MNRRRYTGGKLNFKSLKRLIFYVFQHYWVQFLLVVLCIIVASLTMLASTVFSQTLIDNYIVPLMKEKTPNYTPLERRLFSLIGILILGVVSSYSYHLIMPFVGQGTMKRIRNRLFSHMEELPIRFFDTKAHGDIMSVYTNDVDTLRQVLIQAFPQFINSFISLVATFINMVRMNIPLTIVSTVMVALMITVTRKLSVLSGKYYKKQQQSLGTLNGYVEEMLNGQKVVKVFCREDKVVEGFSALNEELRDTAERANKITNITMPINGNLGNLSFVLCAVIGAVLALKFNSISIGTLVAFLSLNKGFSMPINQITNQLNSIIIASAGAERVFEMTDEVPESDNGYVELVNAVVDENGNVTPTEAKTGVWAWKHVHQADGGISYVPLKGDIEFENVDFAYDESKQILFDINMYAKAGQKIALVGSTGAGKTTITNLINRFYDIKSGKIRYDGINIEKIKKSDLRRSLGIVLQDTNLFTGTVMENIRYGREDATDEECIAAAKLANAHQFIKKLPEGYNTVIKAEGGTLSQGQRQLLSIARAAVADPPVMILDEATSSVDTRTEKLIQKGMDALLEGRTSFVIAHRLSTIKNSDCIMVLENGRIIERGTHDELLEQKGRYYTLYTGNKTA